jgi:hypothetical protein
METTVYVSTGIVLDQVLRRADTARRRFPESKWYVYAECKDDIQAMNLTPDEYEAAVKKLVEVLGI